MCLEMMLQHAALKFRGQSLLDNSLVIYIKNFPLATEHQLIVVRERKRWKKAD